MAKEAIRKFFNDAEEQQIIAAIREAEFNTSGEIRIHIEERCKEDALKRATELFGLLEMHKTDLRNGVLFYLATLDHKFAIVGDEGINNKVPTHFWEEIRDEMTSAFKNGDFVGGLSVGIARSGMALKEYFPFEDADKNELSDEISTS